ncbi:unnamed protein product [Ectocarpus sp. 12 AP-2014]
MLSFSCCRDEKIPRIMEDFVFGLMQKVPGLVKSRISFFGRRQPRDGPKQDHHSQQTQLPLNHGPQREQRRYAEASWSIRPRRKSDRPLHGGPNYLSG